ncbi:ABC transporter substrate-binding protein [Paracoccus siganidrum]|uniref:ABC transporter substrate-binding protein n=1 Tax=Paracoccus siganidrum TaxID=1276757 RepID=A0A418ZYX3_9RHOB|nr:ABC transporter substrate-binding protein [Paracoccus siganidrum]RJL05726.1 ABC transporter substrate-binding protein [Paracoccus siganidrum]RMC26997.1 ABC transporter substrate-binding protein [Paracoccus siganidrum]
MPKFLSILALGLALGSRALAEVTIQVVHPWPGHSPFHQAAASAFMATNPDITVKFRASPESYDTGHQSMIRDAMTGNAPDVYHSGFHLLPELVRTLSARDQIIDLASFIEAEGGQTWIDENFNPAIINLTTIDGKIWAMPFNASTPIIFFNKELIEEAGGDAENLPADWDGWIELAGKISAADSNAVGMTYDVHAWPDDWLWRALISQQGAPFMNEDGVTVAWDNDIGTNALELARRFVTEGGMEMMDFDQAKQQFVAGLSGFTVQSVNSARSFTELSEGKFTLGTAIFPVTNTDSGTIPTGGNGAVILATEPEKQVAAWEYIKFVSSPEGQDIAVRGSGYMPTNQKAMASELLGDFYAENPNWRISLDQIDRAAPWAGYPGTNSVEIWRTQREIIGEVMSGELSVEDGLAEMVKATNDLIAK